MSLQINTKLYVVTFTFLSRLTENRTLKGKGKVAPVHAVDSFPEGMFLKSSGNYLYQQVRLEGSPVCP